MAEFCLQFWNRMNERNDTEREVELSKEPERCEGCGEMKCVVVALRCPLWRGPKWLWGRDRR